MNKYLLLIFIGFSLVQCDFPAGKNIEFNNSSLRLILDNSGHLISMRDLMEDRELLSKDTLAPFMSIRIGGKYIYPGKAFLQDSLLVLEYMGGYRTLIAIDESDSHLRFELKVFSGPSEPDLIVWGPYPNLISGTIGETVGVVWDSLSALGIQALNPKTLGGFPWNENDCMPQIDIFDQDDPSDLSEEGKRYVLYRVEAAKPEVFGSTLQAYCRNRYQSRIIDNWGHERYLSPPYADGGVEGSAISLFACSPEKILETIGEIELQEGLPHPMIEGEWGKTSGFASSAYMIMGFGENDIEKSIEITRRAGLKYLYHPGPFESWGHFELKKSMFPSGLKGLRDCVDRAEAAGMKIGVHTLSNFISTNDPYITPVPDQRLAEVGFAELSEDINTSQKEVPVSDPEFFNQFGNNHLKTVRIGNELIRYAGVSDAEPWILTDCQRGSFGTSPDSHAKGSRISKLADHAYKVFLSDAALSVEIAENIAALFNRTGLRQISFDGLEGNRSTAMGNYGEILFTSSWYNALNDDIKKDFIADASRTSHYFWHIYSRMNWGEPWYAGFRESQTEYRLKNQAYFKRNLMPGMLGWFKMTPETSVEDIEWLLARSAAFDAGYGFVCNYDDIDQNGRSERILYLLGLWEKARLNSWFSPAQKDEMKDIQREFSLEQNEEGAYILTRIQSRQFTHAYMEKQPGEPTFSEFDLINEGKVQGLSFIVQARNARIEMIMMELDHYKRVEFPVALEDGQVLRYDGGEEAMIFDRTWHLLHQIPVDPELFLITPGPHSLVLDCRFLSPGKDSAIKLETRLRGVSDTLYAGEK